MLITRFMKDIEASTGEDSILQSEIIDAIVRQLAMDEQRTTSLSESENIAKKVRGIIDKLVDNEKVLLVVQNGNTRDARYLALSEDIRDNAANMDGLAGTNKPVYS